MAKTKIITKSPLTRTAFYVTATVLLVALLLFTWVAVIASRQVVVDWEITVFQYFYNWPIWVFPIFITITQLGNAFIVPTTMIVAIAHRKINLGAELLMTGTLTYILLIITKELIARPRPAFLFSGVNTREMMVYGYGFPSGHTAISVAVALTLYSTIPKRFRWLLLLWVILVPISRIYLAAHVPTDIIGGYCLGVIAFCIVRLSDVVSTPLKHPKKGLKRSFKKHKLKLEV